MSFFKTGDIYVAERQSIQGLLEKANDPAAEWNEIGICINESSIQGFLLARGSYLKFYTLKQIKDDPLILKAGVRSLGKKFDRARREIIRDYIRTNFPSQEAVYGIKALSRVMQRVTRSTHPGIRTPIYTYTQDGTRLDENGRTIQIPGAIVKGHTTKRIIGMTMYEMVMAVLAVGEVKGLVYDSEIDLNEFTFEGSMDRFLEQPTIFKQFIFDSPDSESVINIINHSRTTSVKDGAIAMLHYFEGEFYQDDSEVLYNKNRCHRDFSPQSGRQMEENHLTGTDMFHANQNFERRTRVDIADRKMEMHQDRTNDRLLRRKQQDEKNRASPMKYK